jgi:hypothetical protein
MELTKDMLASVSQETHVGLCNFTKLQEVLKSHIKSKRVLLILDDVWDGIDDYQWNQLLAPFNSDNAMGNMIIVTTRKPCVAKRRGTISPIILGALKRDDFWLLFETRAFGDVNHEKKESLSNLGRQIAQKLEGNPLAAETACQILSEHHTVAHWSSILKNEEWKSLKLSGDIMSALKLCYDRLPYHLQKCFTYCSLFPGNYRFLAKKLIRIWISQGFVKCNNSSKRLEEIGHDYLDDLVNLGFFVQLTKTSSSGCYYVMYNLMHDFARVVSRTEYAIIDGLQCNRIFPTVRHLSIISDSIARCEKFEEILQNTVRSVGKLRSLVLIGQYDFSEFFRTAFQKAHNLRLLHLSTTSADFCSFLCNLVYPANLRYVTLETDDAEQVTLPQVLSNSFHLQLLCVNQYKGACLHPDISGEPQILPFLERLRCLTRLQLSNMPNVTEVSVPSLEELVLCEMPKLNTCTFVGDLKSSLRVLKIKGCPVLEVFDLFQIVHNYETEQSSWFSNLKKLILSGCPNLHVMIPLPPSATLLSLDEDLKPSNAGALPSLERLHIQFCEITGKWLSMMLRHSPTLKELFLEECPQLTQLQITDDENIQSNLTSAWEASSSVTSSAPDGLCRIPLNLTSSLKKITMLDCPNLIFDESRKALAGFTSLEKLKIWGCPKLFSSLVHNDGQENGRWLLPQSLEKLAIDEYSHETLRPCFVDNLTHLKKLDVSDSENLESLQLDSCTAMRCLLISHCSSLTALEGLQSLVNLRELDVFCSPVLASLATSAESLESLRISEVSLLATSFFEGLSCLRSLTLQGLREARLTDEQDRALLLHVSLQELEFRSCWKLLDLPAGLHSLPL